TPSGTYAGYYEGGITFTAVHALDGTDSSGIPYVGQPNAAAPGAFLQDAIVSVEGPAAGSFQFWEDEATAPTFSYSSGYQAGASPDWIALSDLSTGAGTPGGDPYGHLHGRRFTASTSGEYTVGFLLTDTSANGANGGPIQANSDVLYIRFSAVPEPESVALGLIGLAALALAVRRHRRA
ncbi:MAG: PEP-CTERM sorting domain-containing protein, partial [Verrucomicrobiae bacterium]|nr:PEP-CTERM sorting domain-containing protein [Verrucomicrobiae bacterium]